MPSISDLEDLFENGVVALHLVGTEGTVLYANNAEFELLGYTADEYLGRNIADFHADADTIDDILARLTRGESIRKYPARLRAKNGSIKHVEISSSVAFRNGEFGHTRCFTVDVTDRVLAEQESKRKDDLLKEVLDALPAAIYTTDEKGVITYYNQAAADLAGRQPLLGKDEWCVTSRIFTPDGKHLPHDQCPMAVALKEQRPIRGVEAIAQRPDGTMFPFLPFPTPIKDADGNMIGAVNMLVDISDRKHSETQQRLLLDELNHRVKNNMQMLHGLLRAAEREASPEVKSVLADAGQRVAAMAAAQQVLYNRSGSLNFNVSEFLHIVGKSARQAFGDGVNLRITESGGSLPNDISMPLALILNELLTNAAKHGLPKGEGTITVSLKHCGEEMELRVEDEGPGYDYRPNGKRSSGLGLVAGLVRQLRGSFTVQRGTGARCVVRFPVRS